MSRQLISHSADLTALVDDGYEVGIVSGHLVIHNVPYVNARKQVRRGTLVSALDLAGDVTTVPRTHKAMFAGEHPCDQEGRELKKIKHGSRRCDLGGGLVVDHSFSCKPAGGYQDYYHKMTTYAAILTSPAQVIDPTATAQTRRVIETCDEDSVFKYIDTASSRAEIAVVSEKLRLDKIAIIGLGGTGSYILDFVAKCPVREIHVFDGDDFLQHNAFRAPGAASIEELRENPKKVNYHARHYELMRRGIVVHAEKINEANIYLLRDMDFVFLCVDRGGVKGPIIEKLEGWSISFVDVGMGIELVDGQLQGIVRVTTSTAEMRDHVRSKKRVGFTGEDEDGVYTQNIQVAELNALNAALAVIKWKKLFGFYRDLDHEHHSTYTLDGNLIINDDKK